MGVPHGYYSSPILGESCSLKIRNLQFCPVVSTAYKQYTLTDRLDAHILIQGIEQLYYI